MTLQIRRIGEEVLAIYKGKYPAVMRSLADDLEAGLAHLIVPVAHRKVVRTTNLIERSFAEERRKLVLPPMTRKLPFTRPMISLILLSLISGWNLKQRRRWFCRRKSGGFPDLKSLTFELGLGS